MMLSRDCLDRRTFLKLGIAAGALGPAFAANSPDTKVAIVPCKSYGQAIEPAYSKAFDLLGGIGRLVKGKTVTVKVNLTVSRKFVTIQGRPPVETYITHGDTVTALSAVLFREGARRVRIVESFPSAKPFEESLADAGWDVPNLLKAGRVELENTRNLGIGKQYSTVKVSSGGNQFSSFDLNHSYTDTDVFVSLAKLKHHKTAGVTLSLKNLFGITPNALYGDQAPGEQATAGRGRLHFGSRWARISFPGQKENTFTLDSGTRVPGIIADLSEVRPVHLAIIDAITSVSGGEGPWVGSLKLTDPGMLIVGLNPVATDAVATAVMSYDPRSPKGTKPFGNCENHLLLAEKAGVGTADLSKIDVRGMTIELAKTPYA